MTTTYLQSVEEPDQEHRTDRRRLLLIIAAALVVLAVFGTWLVAFSSVFGVRHIEVRGAHSLSAAQVEAAARISHGTPLVRVDTAGATRRIEQLPDVASAQVSTSFPSTVVITVDERVPVGYVQGGGGTDELVDQTGAQYRAVSGKPAGLPKLVLPSGSGASATAAALATVAAALPSSVRSQVNSIQALNPNAITLLLSHGRVVQWGTAARSADKARVLPVLLSSGADQVDVTDPDQPFTR